MMYGPTSTSGGNNNVDGTAEAIVEAIRKKQAAQADTCRRCFPTWKTFAERHGLLITEEEDGGLRSAKGQLDDLEASVEVVRDDDGWLHTLVTVTTRSPRNVVVSLYPSPKGIMNAVRSALFGPKDISVGDAAFDKRFLIHGEPAEAAPEMLGVEARARINAWCGEPLEAIQYDRGTVYVQSAGVETTEVALDCALAIAIELAKSGPSQPYR